MHTGPTRDLALVCFRNLSPVSELKMGGMRILAAAAPFLATAVGLTLGRNHNGIELSTQGRVVEGNAIQRTGRVLLQDSAARSDPDHGALADEKGYFTSLDTDKGIQNATDSRHVSRSSAALPPLSHVHGLAVTVRGAATQMGC